MTQKIILPFGDPILRRKAKPVTEFDQKLNILLDDLTDTLYATKGSAGLAAPQIGVLKRVVVIDCGNGKMELINPQILEMTGEQTGEEGCLSLPGYTGIVKRANYVKVKTRTRDHQSIIIEGRGFLARCLQHEIDHLDGVLYIDHIIEDKLYDDLINQKADLQQMIRLSKGEI